MIPRVRYHNKLLVCGRGGTEQPSLAGVVDAGTVEVVSGARVQWGRPCFLSLPLPRLEPGVRPAITDLYNIYKIKNIRHKLTK